MITSNSKCIFGFFSCDPGKFIYRLKIIKMRWYSILFFSNLTFWWNSDVISNQFHHRPCRFAKEIPIFSVIFLRGEFLKPSGKHLNKCIALYQSNEGWKHHILRYFHSKDLTKFAILHNYKHLQWQETRGDLQFLTEFIIQIIIFRLISNLITKYKLKTLKKASSDVFHSFSALSKLDCKF